MCFAVSKTTRIETSYIRMCTETGDSCKQSFNWLNWWYSQVEVTLFLNQLLVKHNRNCWWLNRHNCHHQRDLIWTYIAIYSEVLGTHSTFHHLAWRPFRLLASGDPSGYIFKSRCYLPFQRCLHLLQDHHLPFYGVCRRNLNVLLDTRGYKGCSDVIYSSNGALFIAFAQSVCKPHSHLHG